ELPRDVRAGAEPARREPRRAAQRGVAVAGEGERGVRVVDGEERGGRRPRAPLDEGPEAAREDQDRPPLPHRRRTPRRGSAPPPREGGAGQSETAGCRHTAAA